MAKSSRFKHQYSKNASKLHKAAGEILRSHRLLKHYKAYQEYPVSRVNPDYKNNAHMFDWCIPDLKVCIEIHGQQHFKMIPFFHKSDTAFQDQLRRDKEKKDAAEEAGWTYFMVRYDEELDVDALVDLVIEQSNTLKVPERPVKALKKQSNAMTQVQKEKAREWRRKQYKKSKEYFKKIKQNKDSSD